MSDQEEWGPWIEHDGKGCPLPAGTDVHAVDDVKGFDAVLRVGYNINPRAWLYGSRGTISEITGLRLLEITRYRIRKPRGMAVLEALLQDLPEEIDA